MPFKKLLIMSLKKLFVNFINKNWFFQIILIFGFVLLLDNKRSTHSVFPFSTAKCNGTFWIQIQNFIRKILASKHHQFILFKNSMNKIIINSINKLVRNVIKKMIIEQYQKQNNEL